MKAQKKLTIRLICLIAVVTPISASCKRNEPAGTTEGRGDGPVEAITTAEPERPPTAPVKSPEPAVSGGTAEHAVAAAGGAAQYQAATADGTYAIVLTTSPQPIPLNRLFSMEVEIRLAASGELASDVVLAADAAMPHHGHGMNTLSQVRQTARGRFAVTGMQFHMPGYWEFYFDVTREGLTERAYLSVEL